jgi:hypothetical protein
MERSKRYMINVALLSRWHVHADDYAKEAGANEHLNIVQVWDEDPERGEVWAGELGVPFEKDLEAVLSNSDVDAVIVTTPTICIKKLLQQPQSIKSIFIRKKYWHLLLKIAKKSLMQLRKTM